MVRTQGRLSLHETSIADSRDPSQSEVRACVALAELVSRSAGEVEDARTRPNDKAVG